MTDVKQQGSKIVKTPRVWPGRLQFTLLLLSVAAGIAIIIYVLKNNVISSQIQAMQSNIADFFGQRGFSLQDVIISGHKRTSTEEINKILGIKRGDNFIDLDAARIKRRLENLPWVRDVTVKKLFLPNIIQINIVEKEVLALWQLNHRFYPLDLDGYVIEAEYKPVQPTLLVIGEEAPEHIKELLQTIKNIDDSYISRLEVANYISKRRWNITFDDIKDGITVKLPQDNFASALRKLINLDKTSAILKRKLTIIDLRLADKITVKIRKSSLK